MSHSILASLGLDELVPKAIQTLYVVPAQFIHRIQWQVFWDHLDPANAISLRVQKMFGFRTGLPLGSWKDADWEPSTSG